MIAKQIYLIATISLFILSIFIYQYFKIQNLNTKILNFNTECAYNSLTIEKLQNSNKEFERIVTQQNKELSKISLDLDEARQKLDEWKSKKPEVRYEVIYKIREMKSNECEDIKSAISGVRSLDFNEL